MRQSATPPTIPLCTPDRGWHILNFLSCIKSRQRPVCDMEIGAVSAIPTLIGGVSIRSGGKTIDGRISTGTGLASRLRE